MSTQITTAFAKQYDSNCQLIVQQMESRVREKAMVKDITNAKERFMDYVGKVNVSERTTRHGDTTYSDTPHTRRMITAKTYHVADLIDRPDQVRTLIDPQNPYLQAMRAGMNRKIDNVFYSQLLGTAYAGEAGGTSRTMATLGTQQIATGSVGMSTNKLIEAMEILNLADVPDESEGGSNFTKWCAIGPHQVSDLLKELEVGSSDYNIVRPLVEGKITRFMGFNFILSNQLPLSSTTRSCVAWVKAGAGFGLSYDITATVDRMPNKMNSTQVYLEMMFGVTRLEEELVVQIDCTES
jgi:hypothetical protein